MGNDEPEAVETADHPTGAGVGDPLCGHERGAGSGEGASDATRRGEDFGAATERAGAELGDAIRRDAAGHAGDTSSRTGDADHRSAGVANHDDRRVDELGHPRDPSVHDARHVADLGPPHDPAVHDARHVVDDRRRRGAAIDNARRAGDPDAQDADSRAGEDRGDAVTPDASHARDVGDADARGDGAGPVGDRRRWPLWVIGAHVGALGVLTAALSEATAPRWLGAAVALFTLTGPARRLLARAREGSLWRPWTGPLIAACVLALVLLGELVLGHPPASRDHGIHYLQTEIVAHDLLPGGQLFGGWTDRINNGHALADTYPIFGHVWMAAAHVLSLGAIDLRTSYAWGQLLMWLLAAGGVGALAGAIGRELLVRPGDAAGGEPVPKNLIYWGAFVGAALWLLDPGASREGGWHYLMFHGVWPQLLSTTLWILGVLLAWRATWRPSPRRASLAALALAGGLLAHPFALLTSATTLVCGLLVLALRDERPRGAVVTWLIIHVLATAVALGWLTRLLGGAEGMGRSPVIWAPWDELSAQVVTGELFHEHRALVGPLALLGAGLAARRVTPLAWLTLLAGVALLVQGSADAVSGLRLDLLVPALKNLQFIRYSIAVKPLWYALAGAGAAALLVALGRLRAGAPTRGLTVAQRAVLCALLGPLLVGALDGLGRVASRPVGAVDSLESTRHGAHAAALARALEQERERLEGAAPRVAFLRRGMSGATYPLLPLADVGAAVVLDGHVPSINTEHRVSDRRASLLRALGVTHVLHDRPLPPEERRLAGSLDPLGTFGDYTLARLRPPAGEAATPERVPGLAEVATGGVTLRAQPGRAGAHALELSGAAGPTPVDLLLAPHRFWRARFVAAPGDGPARPLELRPRPLHQGGLVGMRLTAPGDGQILLTFEPSRGVRVANGLALAALGLCLLGLARGRPVTLGGRRPRAAAPGRRARIALWSALAASVVAAGLALAWRQQRTLERTWTRAHDTRAFVRDLVIARRFASAREPDDVCDALLGRDSRRGCSAAVQRARVGVLYRAPYLYRCLAVTVPAGGQTEVEFHDIAPGHTVRGMLARDPGLPGSGKLLRWSQVDPPAGASAEDDRVVGRRTHGFEVSPAEGRLRLRLRNGNKDGQDERVCVAAAELR